MIKNITLQLKSELSRIHAQIVFGEYGNRSKYISSDGTMVLYEPTSQEIKSQEESLKVKTLTINLKKISYISIYYWLTVLFLSLLCGFLIPIKKITPNQGIQADAAAPHR
jgi:hypothetical protein